jgi:hypothetical protein
MKSVKLPDVSGVKDGEGLIRFYEKLGWDKQTILNPVKIKVPKSAWEQMCGQMPDAGAKMSFVNWGPSSGDGIPGDRVHIYKGAF